MGLCKNKHFHTDAKMLDETKKSGEQVLRGEIGAKLARPIMNGQRSKQSLEIAAESIKGSQT